MTIVASLTDRVLNGDQLAIARMITRAECRAEGVEAELAELHRRGGHGWIVGITGPSGSGKSTLVGALTRELRRRGGTVGVLAVDPTSPLSGGAILGDRIRLGNVAEDPGVYIRSMASRGRLGGLARVTFDAITILDAAGKDWILVETVGVGQDEVEIATSAHTTLVVSVPGLGDDIQAIKAGVLEIADIHVVNKADLDGADRTAMELKTMLSLGRFDGGGRKPHVLKVVATNTSGIEELANEIEDHANWLRADGRLADRERKMLRRRISTLAKEMLAMRLMRPDSDATFEAALEAVRVRRTDAVSVARQLIVDDRNQS